jgi:hypothetical protein
MAGKRGQGRPKQYRQRAASTALTGRRLLTASQRLEKIVGAAVATWAAWLVFLKGLEGELLSSDERATWDKHASHEPRDGQGFREAVCVVGRRAGKSTVAAALGVNACLNARPPAHAEQHVVAMAQTETNARRVLFAMAQSIAESDIAINRRLVEEPKRGELAFDTGTRLVTLPCVPSALRGYASPLVVLDELGFYGPEESLEAVRAARPTLATVEGSRLVVISSPGPPMGALYEMSEKPGADTLVWRASGPEMNPSLPADYLDRLKAEDPIGYRQEVLAEFVSGISTLLDATKIEGCVRSEKELAPKSGTEYRAFTDMSGGRHDAATFAVGHVDADGNAVIDLLRRIEPPFSPADVVDEFTAVARDYCVSKVTGDQYAAALNADLWEERGIHYEPSRFNRSQLYLSLVGPINQGRVRMPRMAILQQELRQLQRRKTRTGRESVDHPQSGSDDAANAMAGVVFLLLKRRPDPLGVWHQMLKQEESAYASLAVH